MFLFESTWQEPEAPATLPKDEVLDASKFPTTPSDLDFRPTASMTSLAKCRTAGWILLAAFFSIPASIIVAGGFRPLILDRTAFMATVTVACLLGLWRAYSSLSSSDREPCLWFLGPIGTWGVLAFICSPGSFGWSFLFLVLAGAPFLVLAADSIATHAVFWMSANPLNEFPVRDTVRSQWSERLLTSSRHESTQPYRLGLLLLLPALLLSTALTLTFVDCNGDSRAHGMALPLILSVVLFTMGWLRSRRLLPTLKLTWHFVNHWMNYGADQQFPPYVFQSPSGTPFRRQFLLLASVFVLGAAIFKMTNSFSGLSSGPDHEVGK